MQDMLNEAAASTGELRERHDLVNQPDAAGLAGVEALASEGIASELADAHRAGDMAGRRETEALKPIDKPIGKDGERVAGP
jgi:hypothetical protein